SHSTKARAFPVPPSTNLRTAAPPRCGHRPAPRRHGATRCDTQPRVPTGSQLPAHAHYHVDTRPSLSAPAWALCPFAHHVVVIVVVRSGVAYALQNSIGSAQGQSTQRQDDLPIHAERNDSVCPVDTARCGSPR